MKTPGNRKSLMSAAVIGTAVVLAILIFGTVWTGQRARRDTSEAVSSVSQFYLNELAARREQVVADNLQDSIDDIYVAVSLIDGEDLSDEAHLQQFQRQMKQLYSLERFAFIDSDGTVYTSQGTTDDIGRYSFDYLNLTKPEISVSEMENQKKVIIAVPIEPITFQGNTLIDCFMQIDMDVLIDGLSLRSDSNNATFCNLYTQSGEPLTEFVLGGLAGEDNLLDAMQRAVYARGYTEEKFREDFTSGADGVVSFTYNGIRETLYYTPVEQTDWMLTYLIRENVLDERVRSISTGIIVRSLVQTALLSLALVAMFAFIISQIRKNASLALEKETSDAENRVKQEELEARLLLQEQIHEQDLKTAQQNSMISALSADYRSVYYVDLDADEGVCYQAHTGICDGREAGEHFPYESTFADYAGKYVTESYREEFLRFVQKENLKEALKGKRVISYRYLISRDGAESWEMVRFAGVRRPEDREDGIVHAAGASFVDVDEETKKMLTESAALATALTAAEDANRAKTAFLSNMSHEIRTPMNAIIGLDSIALNDEETPEKTKEYLRKIDSSAQHLLNIINDILDMSRIESGRMALHNEEFSFQKVLEQVNSMISGQCREKGLNYECRIRGKVDDYYIGDDMKLRQILINILGNAVKFTPEGGSVSLIVEETARFDGKSTLEFVMSDTGIGISKEFLPKIFEAFTQEHVTASSRYGSTGLGLPITKSLVELMNGTISVESEKGSGTTFTVTVTLTESGRSAESSDAELKPGEMTVLVIDDDPVALEHAGLVLGKAGIRCETASSGAEAVEMVELRHARREPYHLILVDWKMPEMDGIETTRRIRSIVGNDSAIIILTSYNWDDVHEEAVQAGVDSFVAKPLFAATVLDEFRLALSKKNEAARKKADLKDRRILLAEDMPVNAEIMMMVLSSREMVVDHAENGRIALEKFESHPEGWYDAILMDMRMPEMDGLEATRRIRACGHADSKTIPIIALTANAFDEDVQRSMQAGLNAHLSKPVEPEVLFETLENLIRA